MDLFKLLGTISIKNSDANNALDETSKKGQQTASKLGTVFSGIGKFAVGAGKAIATGLAVGATAVGALVTKSVQSYAEYEQLVGGVETLFKESAGKVQAYAEQAYNTAGLSANEYMETVTSFSASLLQSLGGDTEKSADYANRAIIDMSDNANKMGTSMEMIQNAYNGFAKQNYTMLDNLKLGYGGTKEEMERLIADASKMTDVQGELGVTVDANSMSFGNIVNAISVMQKSMGIAGTTSAEASGTISGSMASVKASWKNLVTAIASDDLPFDEYVDNFVASATTMASNMLPRIQVALNGVVKLIDELAPVIIQKVPELLSSLLPAIVDGAISIVNSLIAILPSAIDMLINEVLPAVLEGVINLFNALLNALPSLIDMLVNNAIPQIFDAMVTIVNVLIESLPVIIEALVSALPTLIPVLVSGLVDVFVTLCEAVPQVIQPIIDYLPMIVMSICDALIQNTPIIFNALITLMVSIIEQLPMILQALIDSLPYILEMVVTALVSNTFMLIDGAIQVVIGIVKALPQILLSLTTALPQALLGIWEGVKNVFLNVPEWFGNLFSGAKDLIVNAWSSIVNYFSGIWDGIKNVFSGIGNWFKNKFTEAKNNSENAWSNVREKFSNIKDGIQNVFSNIGNWFGDKFTEAKNAVTNAFSGLTDWFSDLWEGIKDIFSGIGEWFSDLFSDIGEWFSGGSASVTVSAGNSTQWHADGGIMTEPMLFGYNPATGTFHGGGEAGDEAIAPISTLQQYVSSAVASQNAGLTDVLHKILGAVMTMDENMGGNMREALGDLSFNVNNREFARLVKGAM